MYLEPIPDDCLLGQTKYTTADFDTSRDKCILALFLCFGTVWLGLQIFNFRHSPFLSPFVRELISDYALAFSVIIFSVIGSVGFKVLKSHSRLDSLNMRAMHFSLSFRPSNLQPSTTLIWMTWKLKSHQNCSNFLLKVGVGRLYWASVYHCFFSWIRTTDWLLNFASVSIDL